MQQRRGPGRSTVTAVAVFLAAVIALAWVVGDVVRSNHHFNWALAFAFGTALGTTLLALATGALALSTAQDVRASTEIADLTRKDQQHANEPLVLLERVELTIAAGAAGGALHVTLRNVGRGPMVRGNVGIKYQQVGSGVQTLDAVERVTSLLSGERERFSFNIAFSQPLGSTYAMRDFTLDGAFLDASGNPHPLDDGQPLDPGVGVTVSPSLGRS